jgi:hypothetical protein
MARVLIGCETSGIVRDAFLAAGHDCWSCDVLPADTPTNRHIQDDVRNVMAFERWDFMAVMHPPCTRLCNSGVRWLHKPPKGKTLEQMWADLDEGCALFSDVWNADIPLIAVENPVMHKYAKARIRNFEPQAQTVQPWEFADSDDSADNVTKATCFWLRGLPQLQTTGTVDGKTARDECHKATPSPDRWKIRSKFHHGIAAAMAEQWGAIASTVEQ